MDNKTLGFGISGQTTELDFGEKPNQDILVIGDAGITDFIKSVIDRFSRTYGSVLIFDTDGNYAKLDGFAQYDDKGENDDGRNTIVAYNSRLPNIRDYEKLCALHGL